MKIGNIEVGRLCLGPMAGVTDRVFRMLCREQGADFVYTEMVSAKGVHYNNSNTKELLRVDPAERPAAIQLFGEDPVIMSETARRIEDDSFDFFDINMGCPVPKVVNNHEGSALMKNPARAAEIVSAMVKAVSKPVIVKFRKGFTEDTVNAPEFARIMEESGASAVAVHGRTREQYYSGQADWNIIREVKNAVKSIPVIGNGDIFCPEDAERMMKETGCDAVMIARGARGNPWIFNRVKTYLDTGIVPEKPGFDEVIEMIFRHADMLTEDKGEFTAVHELRKHVAWYTAGFPHSAVLRKEVNLTETLEGLKTLLNAYRDRNGI